MGDYFTSRQLSQKLGITESELQALESIGHLQATINKKNGGRYYSGRQAYRLRAALHLARQQELTLREALERLEHSSLHHVETCGE